MIFRVANLIGIDVKDVPSLIADDIPKSLNVSKRKHSFRNITIEDFEEFCAFAALYGYYHPIMEKEKVYFREVCIHLLKFCRFTGLRPSEAIVLTKDDVINRTFRFRDLETRKIITVDGFLIKLTKRLGSSRTERNVNVPLKTESSYRAIPIVNPLDIEETNHILQFTRSNLLFGDYKGRVIPTRRVSDFIRRVRLSFQEHTGKDLDIYLYLMRKTLGSDHRGNHVDRTVTRDIMGQSSEETVGRFYSSASDEGILNALYHRKYLTREQQNSQLVFTDEESHDNKTKDQVQNECGFRKNCNGNSEYLQLESGFSANVINSVIRHSFLNILT